MLVGVWAGTALWLAAMGASCLLPSATVALEGSAHNVSNATEARRAACGTALPVDGLLRTWQS